MTLLSGLDHASVFVFALTGALVASRAQLDIVGFVFVACIAAVGGGTVRDVVLDRNPVFWIGSPSFILLAAAAAVLVFFTAHLIESRYRAIEWLDAAALAIAVPAGAGVAAALGHSPAVVVLMGIATGTLGGLARDVVCNEVPLVLKKSELYVTAALAGALAGVLTGWMTVDERLITIVTAATTFALRAGSLMFGWKLPVYRARPPRG